MKKIIEVLVLISLNHRALFITLIFTVFTLPTYNHGRFSLAWCFVNVLIVEVLSSWLGYLWPPPQVIVKGIFI